MRIIYHTQVVKYLNELVEILYEQQYFGFKESAYDYVDWILDRIAKDINLTHPKIAPEHFSKYGTNLLYISIKRNVRTTWYVFFNQEADLIHIRYISNNHKISQYL